MEVLHQYFTLILLLQLLNHPLQIHLSTTINSDETAQKSLKMSRKLLKLGVAASSLGAYTWALRTDHETVNSIGLIRLSRAAYSVFKISVIYRTNLYGTGLDHESDEYLQIKSACHRRGAENLLDLCCKNKGIYIKVGQYVAALDYLLPKEYVETMKVLHSHAPENTLDDVSRVLKEDLGKDIKDLFSSFEEKPLGTASLAQVHKAVLHDGQTVAVKVQHPFIRKNCKTDLKTMEYLVKIVSWVFPEFQFQWVVDETKKNVPIELNFEIEASNATKIAELFKECKWLKVPKVYDDLSTQRVLIMEFVEGGQVNDLKYIKQEKIDPFEISAKLGQLYSKMIFIHGFVHSDPHPGNILVKKTKQGTLELILLDHGIYANLSRKTMVDYANLWLSILDRDRIKMRTYCSNLGISDKVYPIFACMITGRTWDSIMAGLESSKRTKFEKDRMQNEFPKLLPNITEILNQVNPEMLLILKTNDLMRGIESTLKTTARMGAFQVMSECCVKSVYKSRIDDARDRFSKLTNTMAKYWLLFKLNMYYTYLNLRSGRFIFA